MGGKRFRQRVARSGASPRTGTGEESAEELRWITEMLWERVGLRVVVTQGAAFPGALEAYTVVPRASRPRFLLPVGSGRVAASALSAYNAIRPWRMRLARRAVASTFRSGLGPRIFRDRVVVVASEDIPGDQARGRSLLAHLEDVLGVRPLQVAIGVRPPGVFGKPVLQLFTPDGRPVAYAKVGWSELTRELIRAEAMALRAWERRPSPLIGVPQLVHHGPWEDLSVSVTSPLPGGIRRYHPEHVPPRVEVSRAVMSLYGEPHRLPLAQSHYWRTLWRRLVDADIPVCGLVERLERDRRDVVLAFGAWHGDWVPWNLARFEQRIYAWDWEQSSQEVPVGFDVMHFHFQQSFIRRREELQVAVTRCRRDAAQMLDEIGVPTEHASLVLVLYLLETYLRYLTGVRSGAPWLPRFHPAIISILEVESDRLFGD